MIVLAITRLECARLIRRSCHSLRRMKKRKLLKRCHPPFILLWCTSCVMIGSWYLTRQSILFHSINHQLKSSVIIVSLLMRFFYFLTTSQLCYIIFPMLHKYLQNIWFHLSWVHVIFKNRVEYIGHDLASDRNCPAVSKFSLRQDWLLPSRGISLLSIIGLFFFYNRYCSWFETNIKPLRKLQRTYHHKDISMMGYTQSLTKLFCDCKTHLVTSLLLLRFNSSRPTFLK